MSLKFEYIMKALFSVVAVLLSFTVYSQNHYRLSETGMKFKFLNDAKGKTASIGDFVTLDMVMSTQKGKVLRSSYQEGKPVLFPVKLSAFEGDIYEAVGMLSQGDSAEFLINADSMYAKVFRKPKPDFIAKGEELKFVISAHKIRSQIEYKQEQEANYQTKYKEQDQVVKARIAKESAQIEAFFKNEGKDEFKKTEKGVYYFVDQQGKGKQIEKGNAVVFHYVGKLINGKTFEDTHESQTPFSFTVGEGNVIPGWEDVFPKLKTGSIVTLGIPSDLAYGQKSKGDVIAPHSILIFEINIQASY